MNRLSILLLAVIPLLFTSCLNEEGEGGTSTIQGKVYKVYHPKDEYSFIIDELIDETDSVKVESFHFDSDTVPAAKEKVYIIYGDEPIYGDRMDIGIDGFYQFKYLTKGTYTIYAFTEHTNSLNEAVTETVSVKNGEVKNVPNIYIHDGKALGKSYVKGVLHVRFYDSSKIVTALGGGVRMYIRKVGAEYFLDDVRTGSDGVFIFQGLEPGEYEIFTYTQDDGYKIERIVNDATRLCLQKVRITESGQIVTLKTPFKITINA